MSAATPSAKVPLGFLVLTFAAGIAVAAVIIYFGVRGQIGTSIP